jgi:UDP-GlcNAc3NAcA epimerase
MPEEVNRIIADTFASVLLCPIDEAKNNLEKEGINHSGVHVVGDVMCDMIHLIKPKITRPAEGEYYYCTIHRPYNTDDPGRLKSIIESLNSLDLPVYFPIHPRTWQRLKTAGTDVQSYTNIRFIEPVGYTSSISYQAYASCIITDSGGIQKEAYMLGRKCITLRSETEWNETLAHGWNTLVFEELGHLKEIITAKPGRYYENMFGDGRAAERISRIIQEFLYKQE